MPLQSVTIHHFAGGQNTVFVPALLLLLAATVAACLPVVFAPGLRRSRRLRPVAVLAGVVAIAALIGAGWEGGVAVRALGVERGRVAADVRTQYGTDLGTDQIGTLVDGGKVLENLPEVASAAGLANPTRDKNLKLVLVKGTTDRYDLTIGGRAWPAARSS